MKVLTTKDHDGVGRETNLPAASTYGEPTRRREVFTFDTVAALRLDTETIAGDAPRMVLIRNYRTSLVGGGGVYALDQADTTSVDDGGSVIVTAGGLRYKPQWTGMMDVNRFGAHPSTTAANNSAAIQACEDYCQTVGGSEYTFSIPGRYLLAKRGSAPTDRAIIKRPLAKMVGMGSTPAYAGSYAVTLEPNENMTLMLGSTSIITAAITSISNATPGVVTRAGHGLISNQLVYLLTDGALPTGLTTMRPYYVRNVTTNTFELSKAPGGSSIATSSAGSGSHTLLYADGAEHSVGIKNINLYGGTSYNVQVMAALDVLDAEIDDLSIGCGDHTKQRHGLALIPGTNPAWVNKLERVSVGGFKSGVGCAFYGSDSELSDLYLSGNGRNLCISEGALSIHGQFEVADNGGGAGTGDGLVIYLGNNTASGFSKISGKFHSNARGVAFDAAPAVTTWPGVIDAEFREQDDVDIDIGANIRGGTIRSRFDFLSAGTKHIRWANSNNQGWIVDGYFDKDIADRFTGLPADARVFSSGPTSDKQFNRLSSLVVASPSGAIETADARVNVYGNDTVLGVANANARFGLARDGSGFDAGLVVSSPSGNTSRLTAANGELTTNAGFELAHNATMFMSGTSTLISSKVAHTFEGTTKVGLGSGVVDLRIDGTTRATTAYYNAGVRKWVAGRAAGTNTGNNFEMYPDTWGNVAFILDEANGRLSVPGAAADTTASGANMYIDSGTGRVQRSTSSLDYKREVYPLEPVYTDRILKVLANALIWYRSACEGDNPDWSYYGIAAEVVALAEVAPQLIHWKTHEAVTVEVELEVERPKMRAETYQDIVFEDGKAVLKTLTRETPILETLPVWQEDGQPFMLDVLDKDGQPIGQKVQATIQRPVTEIITETVRRQEMRELETPEVEGFMYERCVVFLIDAVARRLGDGPSAVLGAALDEAIAQDDDRLFSDTDDITEKQALEAALAQKAEELAIASARIAELEAQKPETPPPTDPLGEDIEKARRANQQMLGGGEERAGIPSEIAELMEPGETFTQARKRLSELLNVEKAELRLKRAAGSATDAELKREADVDRLQGLFSKLGEI